VAALLALGVLAGTTACGNAITVHHAGQLGITVDQAHRPVVAVMSCNRATPVINMAEGRRASDPDTKPNTERGAWKARTGFAGVQQFPLAAPGDGWATELDPGTLEPDRLFIVYGGTAEDENASLVQVSFRLQDLATLSPGQIRTDGKVEPLATFGAYRCS
jgi:hypothetical protein